MKKLTEMLTNTTETTSTTEVKEQLVEAVVRTINIYYFEYSEGKLIVKYNRDGRKYRATAHPALKVAPLMKKDVEAVIYEHKDGFKLLTPCPTKTEIAEYNAKQQEYLAKQTAEPEKKKLTKTQLAYLASF